MDRHSILEMEGQGRERKGIGQEESTRRKLLHASEPPDGLRNWGPTCLPRQKCCGVWKQDNGLQVSVRREQSLRSPHQLFVARQPEALPTGASEVPPPTPRHIVPGCSGCGSTRHSCKQEWVATIKQGGWVNNHTMNSQSNPTPLPSSC